MSEETKIKLAAAGVGIVTLIAMVGCSITSQDSDRVGMMCVRGHDRVTTGEDTMFVCDFYSPSP